MNRKYIYLLYAVLLHTLLDAPLPLFAKAGMRAGEIDEVTSSASQAKGI